MNSKKSDTSAGKTDQYGRKQFQINSNADGFQPPKPEKPSKHKDEGPAPEKKKLLQPVGRDLIDPNALVGKSMTITAQTEESKQSAFYCETCKMQLQDSSAWYDHINGKGHNQRLGMSMVVERVGLDRVKEKLAGLKRKAVTPLESIEDIQRRIDEQEQQDKEKRHKRRKVEKEEKRVALEEELDEEGITAFGLPFEFGSTKKR